MRVLNEQESREVAGGCFPCYHPKMKHHFHKPKCRPAPVCAPKHKPVECHPAPTPPPAPTPD